jgi:hypothetical protein
MALFDFSVPYVVVREGWFRWTGCWSPNAALTIKTFRMTRRGVVKTLNGWKTYLQNDEQRRAAKREG